MQGIWKSLRKLFNVDYIEFNTSFSDGHVEGRLHWESDDGTLEVDLPGGNVNLQIGQEILVRVTNKSGSLIPNGSVVYTTGAQGQRPTVGLAKADSTSTAISVLGIATEDIANNGNGYVALTGLVRGVNTSGIAAGSLIYLSESVAGEFVATRPDPPNYSIAMGAILYEHATEGIIGVLPRTYPDVSRVVGSAVVWKDNNIGAATLGGPPGLTPDTVQIVDKNGSNTGIYALSIDTGEIISGSLEMQHDYKEGEDFYFHFHYHLNDAPSGTDYIKFELSYTFSKADSLLDPVTTISIEGAVDTQYKEGFLTFPAISGSGLVIGNQFIFNLKRVAAVGDAFAGEVQLFTVGNHYPVDTIGSRQIGTK